MTITSDKLLKYKKQWYSSHKEQWKKYQNLHKKDKKKYDEQYRKIHKERIKIKKRIYVQQKRKNDIKYRILCNLRQRIYSVIKNNRKSKTTEQFLKCTTTFLKKHLESQFKREMTWDNYGRKKGIRCWHIDHIKPCASFDLSKESEQKKCFHYTNLQPLWAKDNLSKGNKIFKKGE